MICFLRWHLSAMIGAFLMTIFRKEHECRWEYLQVFLGQGIRPLTASMEMAIVFYFGESTSGKSVNGRSAMQMTAVYACVRILSESIADLPVHLYQYKDAGSKVKALEHPLYKILHGEPNPEMTSFVFRETLMTHLLL